MCVLIPGETDIDEAAGCGPITTLHPEGAREKQSLVGGGPNRLFL